MPSPCYRMGIAIAKIPEVTRVGITKLEQQLETYKKKIKIMEHALSASAGAYYNINITQNIVPGTMYQVIEDVEKGFLRGFLSGKLRNVVHNQHVDGLVEVHEVVELVGANRLGILYLQQIGRKVEHSCIGMQFFGLGSDGIGQVSLSHA